MKVIFSDVNQSLVLKIKDAVSNIPNIDDILAQNPSTEELRELEAKVA